MIFNKKDIRANSGGTMVIFAVMLPVFIMCIGVVVDLGRIYAVQSKAQNALDASLLGAASTRSTLDVSQEANNLFRANFPTGYMQSTMESLQIVTSNPDADTTVYDATLPLHVPTIIMGWAGTLFGLPANSGIVDLNIAAQVNFLERKEQVPDVELALVLDNTGSMNEPATGGAASKMAALKTASNELVNIIFGTASVLKNLHVSIIPFDVAVDIGPNHNIYDKNFKPSGNVNWIQAARIEKDGSSWHPNNYEYAYHNLLARVFGYGDNHGYVANRDFDDPPDPLYNDITDAPPTTEYTRFRTPKRFGWPGYYGLPSSSSYYFYPVKADFTSPTLAPLQFALNNRSDILNALNAMRPGGATRINVGLMWGWFTLSPKWQGFWDSAQPTLPKDNNDKVSKVMVLMTDGQNTVYTGKNGQSNDDTKTQSLCDAVKGQSITLYVIGFGTPANINETLLRSCASDGKYFLAITADQLRSIFKAIADDINYRRLRLSQ